MRPRLGRTRIYQKNNSVLKIVPASDAAILERAMLKAGQGFVVLTKDGTASIVGAGPVYIKGL